MTAEVFAENQATTTVSSGGTDAPAGGTQESWAVESSAMFPAASSGGSPPTQFHVADPAAPSEMIAVTAVSGTAWTVTRGAESTTPVTHAAGFTVYQVVTTGGLGGFLQKAGGAMSGYLAPAVSSLTDGSSVTLNAALGNDFRWPLGGSAHTLAAPSNPVNGQPITIAIKYGGTYTPLFNSAFDFGSAGQPAWTAASGKTDYVGFRYDAALNSGAGEWAYQGFVPGLTS